MLSSLVVMSNALERHALAWLSDDGWRAAQACARPEHQAALAQWHAAGWPAVVRRLDADAAQDEVCLGVPLPPDAEGVKVRIPLRVPARHIARMADALELRTALPTADSWRDGLAALCDAAPGLRVFGSLAMQSLTGMHYVSPSSDVDVLCRARSRAQLTNAMAVLAHHAQQLPLDGEIVFPGGAAVSWKEWQMAMTHPAKVLVKELRSVRLADTTALLATLEER